MSRVKKAVLFIIVVAPFMLILMNAQNAKGSAKIGGTFVNSESATVTGSFNYSWEQDKWQQTFESDFQNTKKRTIKKL